MNKFTISVSMLLTGFVIVFAVLFFLIFIIWGYGKIVSGAQHKYTEHKNKKELEKIPSETPAVQQTVEPVNSAQTAAAEDEGVPEEVIAVISAAVYSLYGSKDKVRIKSVKRSQTRSAWAKAGALDNTRPF